MQTSKHHSPASLQEFSVVPAIPNEAIHRAGSARASFQLVQSSEPTWWVYPVDGSKDPILFVGGLHDMVAHINSEHLATGIQYAARQTREAGDREETPKTGCRHRTGPVTDFVSDRRLGRPPG